MIKTWLHIKNHSLIYTQILVPIFFGLWSLLLGQDRNFDLQNYHLYNAFAFLNDKFNIDFAVAELHSYSNPIIDLPYYFLITHSGPKLTAFLFGLLNGLIFLLLLRLAIKYIPPKFKGKRNGIAIFLAFAGTLTPNFLAGLGNSMGDNLTSLLVIFSLLLIIYSFESDNKENKENKITIKIILSGLLMGLATGLKLTNATYALSLSLAILILFPCQYNLAYKQKIIYRFKICVIFSAAAFLGILIASGFWYFKMWQHFNNPFFPSLGNLFPNQYLNFDAFSSHLPGHFFGPRYLYEYLIWPYISSIDHLRAGRGLVHQIQWPIFYSLIIFLALRFIFLKRNVNENVQKNLPVIFLITYVLIAYFIHTIIFSIQRYLVPIEVLLPLLIFLVLTNLASNEKAWKLTKGIIIPATLLVILGGFGTYGHSRFTDPAFNIEKIEINDPKNTTVLITDAREAEKTIVDGADGAPISWVITLLPKDVAFIRIDVFNNKDEIINLAHERDGDKFALFSGAYNWRIDNIKTWNSVLSKLHLMSDLKDCGRVDRLVKKVNFRGEIQFNFKENNCFLKLKNKDEVDLVKLNNQIISNAKERLKFTGFKIRHCEIKKANVGGQNWRLNWCQLVPN
jgi:hypothetical protein